MIKDEVKKVIKEIKPALQRDGGDIKLISVSEGVVKVELQGACNGCPMATQTMKFFVEDLIKNKVKGVKRVERV